MVYHCGFHPRLLGGLNAQFCFDVQRESIIIISWYFAWKWCKNGFPGSSTCNMSSISIQLIYHDVVILFPTSFFGIFMINMVNYVKKNNRSCKAIPVKLVQSKTHLFGGNQCTFKLLCKKKRFLSSNRGCAKVSLPALKVEPAMLTWLLPPQPPHVWWGLMRTIDFWQQPGTNEAHHTSTIRYIRRKYPLVINIDMGKSGFWMEKSTIHGNFH